MYIFHENQLKEEMLASYPLVELLYSGQLSLEEYSLRLDEMLAGGYKQIIVRNEMGELIAMCGYWIGTKLWCGKYVEMDNLIVKPEYRGSGLAVELFQRIEEIGKKAGCAKALLDTYVENFPSHNLYFKQKFFIRGYHFMKNI